MPIVIDLPDNHHATLKTAEEISNRDAKVLRRSAGKAGLTMQRLKEGGLDEIRATSTDAETEAPDSATQESNNLKALGLFASLSDEENDDLDLYQRTCAAVRLIEWSLDIPMPTTPEDVDNLPRPLYEALTTAAAKMDLNESFEKTPESMTSPKADGPESIDSELSLEAASL